MTSASQDSNSQDQSDDESNFEDDYRGKNGVILLIDCRKRMFCPDDNTKSIFRKSLSACKQLMRDLARFGRDDLIGIYVFGCSKGDVEMSLPTMACLHKIYPVTAEAIMGLDNVILDNGESILEKYGQADDNAIVPFAAVMTQCRKIFDENRTKVYSKSVIVLTNDDDPCKGNKLEIHNARIGGERMYKKGIELVPVAIGSNFDANKFYNEIAHISKGIISADWLEVNIVKEISEMDSTLRDVLSRMSRTFRNLHLRPYSISTKSKNISIPVALFNLYKQPRLSMKNQSVEVVTTDTQIDDVPSVIAAPVDPSNKDGEPSSAGINFKSPAVSRKEFVPVINGQTVPITRQTLEDATNKVSVGLTLIGFMPTSDIPAWLTVAVPRIMLPNYFSSDGVQAFTALLDACLRREVSMLCWYKYNRMSIPSLVACHPVRKHEDSQGNISPKGFCIVTIPFDDNYSDPETKPVEVKPSDEQKEAAKKIVKKMTSKYEVGMFHDAHLQKLIAMTEALALNFDNVDEVEDDTDINLEDIDNLLGELSGKLWAEGCSEWVSGSRRPAPSDGESRGPQAKRLQLSSQDMIEACRMNRADKLTMAQLKSLLESEGIYLSGNKRKQDLVDYATKHFTSK